MLIHPPTRRIKVTMTGMLGRASATIGLGLHLLADNKTLNVEYRNRSMNLAAINNRRYDPIIVSSLTYDRIDWNSLMSQILLENIQETENVRRLGEALNFLSVYELGTSEMMNLINIRQNLAPSAQQRVLTEKPIRYLTTEYGKVEPAKWSTKSVQRTNWV